MDSGGVWGALPKKKPSDKPKKTESEQSKEQEPTPKKQTLYDDIDIVARSKEGIYLINDKKNQYLSDNSALISPGGTACVYNKDGSLLAFVDPNSVGLYNFAKSEKVVVKCPGVSALHFSTGQKYLVTLDKREKERHFITVFEVPTLKKIYEYETHKYKKELWPQLRFVNDDSLAFRAAKTNIIEVLSPAKNFDVVKIVETKPFDFFQISPNPEDIIIVCISLEHSAGYEKNEGLIEVYKFNDPEKPLVSKKIDKAHEVNLFFSPDGTNLLAWAQTFTDKTNQSYYGEHILFYLDQNKKILKRVPTYQGPIHDVSWNPSGKDFIVISGFMPAGSVLFEANCTPKFEFGKHHRNTIRWSANSKLISLAGFGNLSGEIETWDMTNLTKIGTFKSNSAVSLSWAPDNRRLMTGVLNPRLRVDNDYKIFKYNGELISTVDFSQTELYEVLWRPGGTYEDRPITPVKKGEKKEEADKKVFRPKGSGSFAAQLKAERGETTEGRYLKPDEFFGNELNLVQEEEPEVKKKKRIRKKKDKKDEEYGGDGGDGYDY